MATKLVVGSDSGSRVDGVFVQLEGVRKVYGSGPTAVEALREVSLQVAQGAFVVLLGPSGSGKTTLLNLLGGLDRPTEGEVIVAGEDISAYSEEARTEYRRRRVGFVFQFYNLVPTLTALENVELIAEVAEDPLPAQQVLESLGLGERGGHFPSQLSGGEQQRVAIARALVKNPDLILADEPTGNLDREAGVRVLGAMQRINRESGKTVVLVTHNGVIAEIANVVLVLRDGQVTDRRENPSPKEASEVQW